MPFLRFDSGPRSGERVPLNKIKVKFGRAKSSDCVLSHPTVSRVHFIVELNNGKLFLVDSGSENGTICNGQRISWIELNDGDKIEAGPFAFLFEAFVNNSLSESVDVVPNSANDETDEESVDTTQSAIHPVHY